MWFMMLPDLLIYFTIFFGGVLTGILSVLLLMLIYCSSGGTIKIQYTKENEIKHEDY
tara:strand:- start:9 stop:179 length:171 start_codon:yes stop_codon:yes gene_type:complete